MQAISFCNTDQDVLLPSCWRGMAIPKKEKSWYQISPNVSRHCLERESRSLCLPGHLSLNTKEAAALGAQTSTFDAENKLGFIPCKQGWGRFCRFGTSTGSSLGSAKKRLDQKQEGSMRSLFSTDSCIRISVSICGHLIRICILQLSHSLLDTRNVVFKHLRTIIKEMQQLD